MKKLFALLTALCLLMTQFVMCLTASAATAADFKEVTVGTKMAGDIAEDFEFSSQGYGDISAEIDLLVELEANTAYNVDIVPMVTVTDTIMSLAVYAEICTTSLSADGSIQPEKSIWQGYNASNSKEDMTVHSTLLVEKAGTHGLIIELFAQSSDYLEKDFSGKYEVLITKSDLKVTSMAEESSTPTYAGQSSVAVAKDGTMYTTTYDFKEDVPEIMAVGTDSSSQCYLSAIAPDGKLKWKFALANDSDATPLVGPDGTVYIGTYATDGNVTPDKESEEEYAFLYGINPDGTQKWKREFKHIKAEDQYNNYGFWFSSAFADGKLIVKTDTELLAINAADGTTIWQTENGSLNMTNIYWANPVIAGGNVYVAVISSAKGETRTQQALLAFDLETGAFKFSKSANSSENQGLDPNNCSMAADEQGILYVIFNHNEGAENDPMLKTSLYAIAPNGDVKWSADTGFIAVRDYMFFFPVLVSQGVVYTAGADETTGKSVLLTYDAKTGAKLASKDILLGGGSIISMALAENGDVYFVDNEALLIGMKADGTYVWASLTDGERKIGTQIAITKDGKLCVVDATSQSNLRCFDIGVGYAPGWSMAFANTSRQNAYIGNYKVSFETNGAAAIATQLLELNELVVKPGDPTKDNAVFKGWFTDVACTQAYDFDTKVNKDFVLYAKWETITVPSEPPVEPTTQPESKPPVETPISIPETGDAATYVLALILMAGGATMVAVSSKKKQK